MQGFSHLVHHISILDGYLTGITISYPQVSTFITLLMLIIDAIHFTIHQTNVYTIVRNNSLSKKCCSGYTEHLISLFPRRIFPENPQITLQYSLYDIHNSETLI